MKNALCVKNLLLCCLVMVFVRSGMSQVKPLRYEVDVKAVLIPFFAVDKDSRPVFDLRPEDISLSIGGRPVRFSFSRTIFTASTQKEEAVKTVTRTGRRVVFIIIDHIFNSQTGLRRSKEITRRLVNEATEGDSFVLLETTPGAGLKYVTGPVEDSGAIEKELKKISERLEWRVDDLFVDNPARPKLDMGISDTRDYKNAPRFKSLDKMSARADKMRYRANIARLSQSLQRFRFVLEQVDAPKIVYLISEGISRGAFQVEGANQEETKSLSTMFRDESQALARGGLYSNFYFDYLKQVVQAVNAGGSMINAINPAFHSDENFKANSGRMTLNYLARESGGKYFAGSDMESLVEDVKQTTSAYYELGADLGDFAFSRLGVKISCSRPGVKIFTLRSVERPRPYEKMKKEEKKIFAMNLLTGGKWSRLIADVREAEFHVKRIKGNGARSEYSVVINPPGAMSSERADLYIFSQNQDSGSLDVRTGRYSLKKRKPVQVKIKKNEKVFLVLIEPASMISSVSGDLGILAERAGAAGDGAAVRSFSRYYQNTSFQVLTGGGELVVLQNGSAGAIKLNGEEIFRQPSSRIRFLRVFKGEVSDMVLAEINNPEKQKNSFRCVILKNNGEYGISAPRSSPPKQVAEESGKMVADHLPVILEKEGRFDFRRRDFYLFLARFKTDPDFQISRIKFPFVRYKLRTGEKNPQISGKVMPADWEHVTFNNTSDMIWSDVSLEGNRADIRLPLGDRLLKVQFSRLEGKWMLSGSVLIEGKENGSEKSGSKQGDQDEK